MQEVQKENETALIRCVGLTIETKSDFGKLYHGNIMLELGCTRVEIGIQSVYDEVLRAATLEAGVTYVSMWELLTVQDLADGIHPNAAGYEKMYHKIYDTISGLLG